MARSLLVSDHRRYPGRIAGRKSTRATLIPSALRKLPAVSRRRKRKTSAALSIRSHLALRNWRRGSYRCTEPTRRFRRCSPRSVDHQGRSFPASAACCGVRRDGDERGENHAFEDKIRDAQKQLAVLECAGLAFVAVHDDESARVIAALNRGAHGVAHVAPFLRCRNSGAAETPQIGIFQFVEQNFRPTGKLRSFGPIVFRMPATQRFFYLLGQRTFEIGLQGAVAETRDVVLRPIEFF